MTYLAHVVLLQSVLFLSVTLQGVLVQPQQLRYNKELSKDVTTLLDNLLREDKYDKRFRPQFGGLRYQNNILHYLALAPSVICNFE